MNRIEKLRKNVDEILLSLKDADDRRCAYVHLYGVSFACAFIAKKMGANVELAVMAGMLHDLYIYKMKDSVNYDEDKVEEIVADHAGNGSVYARETLNKWQLTTEDETDAICSAIRNHSNKGGKFSELDEVLIDADVLQHNFYNPLFPVIEREKERYDKLMNEFEFSC